MIVLDSSAAVELLLALPHCRRVQERLDLVDWQIAAPQLLVIEVLQVLRRRVAAGITPVRHAEQARDGLTDLNVRYYGHELLADRIWQLRENLTAYDASFVAVAEAAGIELLTADARLANSPGHSARICLLG